MSVDPGDPLFVTTWVHVFEQDEGGSSVYRPEADPIPLSRRPRERLQLSADGSACVLTPGPNDAFVEQPATWQSDGDEIVVRTRSGNELRIVDRSATRLLVRTRPKP